MTVRILLGILLLLAALRGHLRNADFRVHPDRVKFSWQMESSERGQAQTA